MARARGSAPLPGLDAPPDAARSRVMRAVRGKDTRPELRVRRLLHRLGYRYRLHVAGLPGKPDLVFPARARVIFVHGCFWHGHDCLRGARPPRANAAYWTAKIARNVERDRLYLTDHAHERWTGRARVNLRRELDRLSGASPR